MYATSLNYVRDEGAGHVTVADIHQAGGVAIVARGNVGNTDDVAKLLATAEKELGPLEVLANNAGITGRIDHFADAHGATFESVVPTNVLGGPCCAQRCTSGISTGAWVRRSVISAFCRSNSSIRAFIEG